MRERKVFQDSVTPLPPQPGLTRQGLLIQAAKPENLTERMTVLFSLAIPEKAKAALEEKVACGETVSSQEFQKSFSPNEMYITPFLNRLHPQFFTPVPLSHPPTPAYAQSP